MNDWGFLGAEVREVAERDFEGQRVRVVALSRRYRTDREDLWEALTSPERIPRWFLPIDGDLQPGGRYQLEGNAGGVITLCDRPGELRVTWEYGGSTSWVHLTLEEEGDGTLLTLEHLMPKDEVAEKHWQEYGAGATGVGWDLGLLGLGEYLGGSPRVSPENAETWMASPPAKAFMRRSAESWVTAQIASGESAELAREMGARTAAAYTGE